MFKYLKYLRNKEFLTSVLVALIPIIFYLKLFNGFFQQDEWFGYGWYILHKDLNLLNSLAFFFAPSVGHYNPLTIIVNHSLFSVWGLNYPGFLIISLILHFVITLLVYQLAKIIFKNNFLVSLLTSLLFGMFASPYQGAGWVIASIATQFSTMFGLMSMIFFFKFIYQKELKKFRWSMVFLAVSLLFKEITIGLFPIFIVTFFLTAKEHKFKLKYPAIIFSIGLIYFLLRVFMIFAPNTTGDQIVTESLSASKLVYNLITVPFKSISQTIFPPDFIKIISSKIALIFPVKTSGKPGSSEFDVFVLKRVMEGVSIFIGILTILLSLFFSHLKKDKELTKGVFLGIAWVILNSLIYSIAPGQSSVIFVVDSRNLYFTSIGVAILIFAIVLKLTKNSKMKLLLLILPLMLLNVFWLNKYLADFSQKGFIRKMVLDQITREHPSLPKRVVFYTESDTSYYGLPDSEKILPFQSGLGQTLLAWYFKSENFPKGFFDNKYLWEITSQGYKEVGDRGFGYFRDLQLFKETVKKYNLSQDSLYAYRWDSKKGLLTDISPEVRNLIFAKNEKLLK